MNAQFFDILGINPVAADQAQKLWPNDLASLTQGINLSDDSLTIVNNLQQGLSFANVRPGVDPHAKLGNGPSGQIAFSADMHVVGAPATSAPFYLRAMPDMGIQLMATDPLHPARVFFALDGRGYELVIDRLPVKILLKAGTASAPLSNPVSVGPFDPTNTDSFAYALGSDSQPAELDLFIRLQVTPAGDVIIEPTVPISLGPCRWLGLPAFAVYDIQIIPSPNRRDYFEWAHNDLGSFISNPPVKGAIGFRSIWLNTTMSPFSDLAARVQTGAVNVGNLELVMEDVVIPLTVPVLPIPSHGTFGFRRVIADRSDIDQAYSFTAAPVQIPIYGSLRQGGNGGTSLTLQVNEFFFRTGDLKSSDPAQNPQVVFQAAIIYQGTSGAAGGGQVGIDDQWTVEAGFVLAPATTPLMFTIADTTVGLVGIKFGISISRLCQQMKFTDSFEALGDLYVSGKPSTPSATDNIFKITSLTGKPLSIVIHDLGWKLGHPSLDGLQMPDGMQLVFANTVHVIIEELGWVEEPNGTPYFSFSGGVAIGFGGGQRTTPAGNAPDDQGSGFGVRVRRLRFRLNNDASQPFLKLDGIFLNLSYAPVITIAGFGYISDFTDSGWAIKEWGFGVKVALNALAMNFSLAAEFIKGNRRNIADPTQGFDYFLAALSLGFLPAGPIGLYDISALVADNMAPNLDSTFPDGEGMALLKWQQNHNDALGMPANRGLGAAWIAQDGALSLGVGCGFSLNGCGGMTHLDIFIFFSKSASDTGILIVGSLFLLKNPKPIAFVAIEYDISSEKFGVMIGVSLNLGDFSSGAVPSWLANIATLSGTLYFGNQPWSFAIGQLADQTTWLSLKVDIDFIITIKNILGVCVQVVDGGPKGFGVVFTSAGTAIWGIGTFTLFGTFSLIIGTWKTGSDSSGLEFWIQVGFKINLFWVFSFGAEIGLKIDYLGKTPWYITMHAEIKIDTPWFLPNVTFTFDKTWQQPQPFDTSTLTQGLAGASGVDPAAEQEQKLAAPGLSDGKNDPTNVYTFNNLNALDGVRIADTHRQDLPMVSVDATIAINFTQPVSNDSAIATTTYDGTTDTGVQQVQDITVRYALTSISVRRAPRFGPTAGTWTDFLTNAQTQFSVGGAAPEWLTFAWETDTRADGKMAPKRLLVNSASPYSFATAAPQNDEEAAIHDPSFPCCHDEKRGGLRPKSHILEFSELTLGDRTPQTEEFSGPDGAWWHWVSATMPTVASAGPAYAGANVAQLLPQSSTVIGYADLEQPVGAAQASFEWDSLPGTLFFEGYSGSKLVLQQSTDLRSPGNTALSLLPAGSAARAGLTRIVLRLVIDNTTKPANVASLQALYQTTATYTSLAGIRIFELAYVTVLDATAYVAATQQCKNASNLGPPGSDASGKLAFLPNHDYEIIVTSTISLGTKNQATRQTTLSEALYFRTKGLPGLNACANVGDDIRRHVDRTYPAQRATPLYRQEPCVVAFENSLSSVLPIDRTPAPGDPPEKAQMFPLELNVDRVVSLSGMKRLTVPSDDWIIAHRPLARPPVCVRAEPAFAVAKVRYAPSHDPLVQRYQAVKLAFVQQCGTPKLDHASQVLLHEPIGADGVAGPWEPRTGYRATVRQKDGPFAERSGFDEYDAAAFILQTDGNAPPAVWSVDGAGNLIAPAAGGGRAYAACGELDWDHLKLHSQIDLRRANAAGIAVGVGNGSPVPQAIICTIEADGAGHALVVRAREGSTEAELGRASVTVHGPVLLTVTAFDDLVRAAVGDVSVDGSRGDIREGRVALVADGLAAFAGIAVGALDIYAFEFATSKYASFNEHLESYDGKLPALAAGSFGGNPASITNVLSANAGQIPAVMQATSDPQQRQKLFDQIVGSLGVGLRKNPLGVTLSRLTDANGTFGFLLQSPEPISLTRDVALSLSLQTMKWVPGAPSGSSPIIRNVNLASALADALVQRSPIGGPGPVEGANPAASGSRLLAVMQFGADVVSMPAAFANFATGDLVVRVVSDAEGKALQIFDAPKAGSSPQAQGALLKTIPVGQAGQQPGLSSISKMAVGTIGVIKAGGIVGPILDGHWVEADVDVPLLILSNGAETSILLLSQSGTPLGPGFYTLHAVLDRDRWAATTQSDPEQHYHDEASITFQW
jgi:hypothetical protein